MRSGILIALLVIGSAFFPLAAEEARVDIQNQLEKPIIRGGILYKSNCILCHGEAGDGRGRASILYGVLNLRIEGEKASEYYHSIISKGSKELGRSNYMPAWDDELTEEQIGDVVAFLKYVTNDVKRGHVVYSQYCILCHGIKGDGNGRAAKLLNTRPSDLTASSKNDDYFRLIIRYGSEGVGRSTAMPGRVDELTEQEIEDVVAYIRTLVRSGIEKKSPIVSTLPSNDVASKKQ